MFKGSGHFTLTQDLNQRGDDGDEPYYSIPGNMGAYNLKVTPTDNSSSLMFASFDPISSDHNDIDVVIRAYSNFYHNQIAKPYMLFLRYGEEYPGVVNAYGIKYDGWSAELDVGKYINGSWTSLIDPNDEYDEGIAVDWDAWFYYRFQVSGSTVRLKIWYNHEVEPTEWLFEKTDTSIPTTGTYPVVFGSSISDLYDEGEFGAWLDYISVGTGGEEPVVPNTPEQYQLGNIPWYTSSSRYINGVFIQSIYAPSSRAIRGMSISWYYPCVASSVRGAVYQGGTIDDPSGATLLYDFGLLAVDTFDVLNYVIPDGGQIAITEDVLWVVIKSDNNDTKVRRDGWGDAGYLDDVYPYYWAGIGGWKRNQGWFDISSEVDPNEGAVFPATIPSASYTATDYVFTGGVLLDGNPFSATTTTTTTSSSSSTSSTASTTSTSSSTHSTTSSYSSTYTSTSSSSTASSTSSFSTTSTSTTSMSSTTATTTSSSTASSTSSISTTSSSMSSTSSFSTTSSSTTTTEPWVGKRLNVIVVGI